MGFLRRMRDQSARGDSGDELLKEPDGHSVQAARSGVSRWMGENTSLDLERRGGIPGLKMRAEQCLNRGDHAMAFALSGTVFDFLVGVEGVGSWDPAAMRTLMAALRGLRDLGAWNDHSIVWPMRYAYEASGSFHPASVLQGEALREYWTVIVEFYALGASHEAATGFKAGDDEVPWTIGLTRAIEQRQACDPDWSPTSEVTQLLEK